MKIELVTRREDLAALAQRWDELAHEDPRDGFFRTSGWYLSWIDHVRPDAQPFVVVARDSSDEIVGLAPLCRVTHRDHWLPMDGVSTAGREVVSGDFLDYLATADAKTQVLPAILDFLWEVRSRWGLLIVGEVAENGDLRRAVESFAERMGLPLRVQEERVCPYIEMPATFDEYLASFSTKRRHELKRQMRVLLEKSGAQVEVCTEPQQVAGNLDILIQLHAGRWNRANQSGNMGRPGFVRFLKHTCAEPPAGASPRLYLLRHEQKPVAALLIFYFGQSALLYSMGWDPESAVAQLSPGICLVAWSIRDAVEHGVKYFDFLRGDEAYKGHLTKSTRKTVTLLVGRSPSARAYLQALSLKDLIKRRFPAGWSRLTGPSDPRPRKVRTEVRGRATISAEPDMKTDATV
jgi:CelD/BcsL family acetyltransferase involved in cellulose biosynthesis